VRNPSPDTHTTSTASEILTLSSFPQAIAHIDCDAFFTSCEESRDPSLKGRPVITGKERGIVACANYTAKSRRIKRGVSLLEAKKVCPDLIMLPNDYELYSIYSQRLFTIIRQFTPLVEEFSIDEAFCNLTGLRRIYRTSYTNIAKMIKKTIQQELDITVSIGLSLSKILAKICSKHNKPDGFLALPGLRLHEFLRHIPLDRVTGFGPNTVALLHKHNIRTVLDYVRRPHAFAVRLLGKIGSELWRELRGQHVYKVVNEIKPKHLTISKSKTFAPASGDVDFVKGQLMRNLESAFIKLRRHSLSARNITVFLRTSDYRESALQARLTRHSPSTLDFTWICAELFQDLFSPSCIYRATGVILSDIVQEGIDSRTLFDSPIAIERTINISKTIDKINTAYGKHTIHVATANIIGKKDKRHARNDLTWRKKELLKGETFRKRIKIPLLKMKSSRNSPKPR